MKNSSRIKKMIESDRFGFVNGSLNLIKRDLENVLNEYFCLTSPCEIEFYGEEENFDLIITIKGSAVRSFNMLK